MNTCYLHLTLSNDVLDVRNPEDALTITAHVKASDDPDGPDLPVRQSWFLLFRHEQGHLIDMLRLEFVNGACAEDYDVQDEMATGQWIVDDACFDPMVIDGESYIVKLVNPVSITLQETA